MKDTIIKGDGTSRKVKAPATIPETFADWRLQLLNGTATLDVSLNADGCETVGTALNKATMLSDATAEALGVESDDPNVNEALSALNKKATSTLVSTTLQAALWTENESSYIYVLSISGVTANSNQEILPALNITAEQLEALQAANIQDGGQAAGSITLKAFGGVPTIDIPIRVIVRGDM